MFESPSLQTTIISVVILLAILALGTWMSSGTNNIGGDITAQSLIWFAVVALILLMAYTWLYQKQNRLFNTSHIEIIHKFPDTFKLK